MVIRFGFRMTRGISAGREERKKEKSEQAFLSIHACCRRKQHKKMCSSTKNNWFLPDQSFRIWAKDIFPAPSWKRFWLLLTPRPRRGPRFRGTKLDRRTVLRIGIFSSTAFLFPLELKKNKRLLFRDMTTSQQVKQNAHSRLKCYIMGRASIGNLIFPMDVRRLLVSWALMDYFIFIFIAS